MMERKKKTKGAEKNLRSLGGDHIWKAQGQHETWKQYNSCLCLGYKKQ